MTEAEMIVAVGNAPDATIPFVFICAVTAAVLYILYKATNGNR